MGIKYFDFFAGIGGFKRAIDSLGIEAEHVGYCEIDKNASNFYRTHYKIDNDSKVQFVKDVEDIKTKFNKNGVKLNEFDLLLAGFPCQSFSNVGYRKGLEDDRGKLFYNILYLLEFYNPKYFVLENVQKLSTINKGDVLSEMTSALECCGYHVHLWDLIASDYGVPQKRRRIFMCGVKKNFVKKINLSPPPKIPLKSAQYPTTWHLLEKEGVDKKHNIPKKTRKTVLYKNPKWCGSVDIDNSIGRPITATMAKWHRANQDNYFSETYIKSQSPWDRPKVDLELENIRRITPLEGFRMQGFEDAFESTRIDLNMSYSASYKLIGNSVPVTMAKAVIHHLLDAYKLDC